VRLGGKKACVGGRKVRRARARGERRARDRTVRPPFENELARRRDCALGGAKKKREGNNAGNEGSAAVGARGCGGTCAEGQEATCK
jgi:hypothetical protein